MRTRGSKWAAVGVAALLLMLGAHFAWEQYRYRLWTPRGTLWVGMTKVEARRALGPPCNNPLVLALEAEQTVNWGRQWLLWIGDGRRVVAVFGEGGRLTDAEADGTFIPRPSLFEHVCSWFGKRGEE
jgi:hypothetical protein